MIQKERPSIYIIMREMITHLTKLMVAIWIGVEVSLPPNPYENYLVVGLISLIILRYDVDKKIIEVWDRWLK